MSISVLLEKHMAMGGTWNLGGGQLADIVLSVLFKGIAGTGEVTA